MLGRERVTNDVPEDDVGTTLLGLGTIERDARRDSRLRRSASRCGLSVCPTCYLNMAARAGCMTHARVELMKRGIFWGVFRENFPLQAPFSFFFLLRCGFLETVDRVAAFFTALGYRSELED